MAQNYDKKSEFVFIKFSKKEYAEAIKDIRAKCSIPDLAFKAQSDDFQNWKNKKEHYDRLGHFIRQFMNGKLASYWFCSLRQYILFGELICPDLVHLRRTKNPLTNLEEISLIVEPEAEIDDIARVWKKMKWISRDPVKTRMRNSKDFELTKIVVESRIYGDMKYREIQEKIRPLFGYYQIEILENIVKEWKKRVRE